MDNAAGVKKVKELLDGVRVCILSTVDEDGVIKSRPMTLQEVEFDGDLWFMARHDSDLVAELSADPSANISCHNNKSWISLSGDAELVDDSEKVAELWQSVHKNWFPEGPDDPNLVLIKIHADGAEYWENDDSKMETLLKLVDSSVRGTHHDMGDKETVEL